MSKNTKLQNNDKAHLNGGGDQPIPDKQVYFIHRLARKKHKMAGGAYCYLFHEKDISELTGSEAHTLIQKLLGQ